MAFEMTPEAAAAVAAYERTLDVVNMTTRRVLTVGRSRTVHALDETGDIWGLKVGRLKPGQTWATALCGQRSPVMNRNFGRAIQDKPVKVECTKCLKVMANIAANAKIKAEAEKTAEGNAE
jgi:hypothetical protein